MNRLVRWYDYLTFNIYFLGLTTVAQTNGLVFPLLVQQFVGEAEKGAYLGRLRLWTLMVALLAQAVMGIFSDRSRLRWGRRRPFIAGGTLLDMLFIAAISFSIGMQGMGGFWFLFAMAVLLQISSNMAQAAQQAVIPDLVPDNQRGRFSGVKAVLEIPLPLILVPFTVARLISHGQMGLGILLAMGILLVCMLLAMFIPEKRLEAVPPPLDWAPILRLAVMTGLFTLIILGTGAAVQLLGRLLRGTSSPALQLAVMGAAGLAAMVIAVGAGVWASVQISVGRAARENPSFTWWVVNRLAFLVGVVNLSTFAVYFIQARLNYPRETAAGPASRLILVVGLFILLSTLPSGWLADRFGRKRLVAISGLLATVGTVIALSYPSLAVIYVGGCLIGLGSGLFYAANWALGTELVPKGEAGRYLGISNLAGAGAGAVGAYIGGPIADYFTASLPGIPGIGYVLLFAIYGMLFALSVVVLAKVKEPTAGAANP